MAAGTKLRCTKEPFVNDISSQKIKSIQFDAFSGDEIRKLAEVQIWKNALYDNTGGAPVDNGLLDLRMGPANKKGKCTTCYGDFSGCPGHFGYLKLTVPVLNVGYLNSTLDILKCICKACGRLLLPSKLRKQFMIKMRNPKADVHHKNSIMKAVRTKCNGQALCQRCGYVNGKVTKSPLGVGFIESFKKMKDKSAEECTAALSHLASVQPSHLLLPTKIHSLFKKMTGEDCELLNLCVRPEKLIVTDIAIPPAPMRPSAIVRFGQSNEDSLTDTLRSIINTNAVLRERLEGADQMHNFLDTWNHLQGEVVQYINSEAPSVKESKNSGLIQRLKGKQGRFRCNLMGKRVEFTGRTVISPDPNLKISEVAVPILMAQVLTYPERVTVHNIEKLRQCIRNGPFKHPGANFVFPPDENSKPWNLKFADRKDVANKLKFGYIVHRHLEDGDFVLFNRQPSLHRMSIMCHRARIMQWRTLRFNESVCNPYNADFDGDEMNIHVPQTEEARTEAFMLMGVQNNLCTPKNGEILVASTQDFLTSSFLITRKDTFYDRASFSLMCSYISGGTEPIDLPSPSLLKPVELWTGKQLFSILVRPNAQTRVFVNLAGKEKIYEKNETMCPRDGYVYFRNSELICGQLGKVTLGNGNKNGLFSVLLRDYNPDVAARCMNRLAKLSARWIGNHGLSIGIDDVQPGDVLNEKKKEKIDQGYGKCNFYMKTFKAEPETLESNITAVLNEIRETTASVCMKELHWRNSPLIMSQCGSKGSPINISQMIACVGQQSVGGRRAANGFIDRTLPHFPLHSKSPPAKGFVANSFYSGLTATEFFFHTMAGREGLVDTAVKTADTGYMSRRLMKALEDLSIYYDQTVRNSSGNVLQFRYGDDGMYPGTMEGQNSTPLNLDQLYSKVLATCPRKLQDSLSPSDVVGYVNERLSKADMTPEGGCSSMFKKTLSEFVFKREAELRGAISRFKFQEDKKEDSDMMEKFASYISGMSAKQLQVFLETCIYRYHKKKIEAGTAIGSISAQSIGEPGTQMTLKTFHFAGVASMNVTGGVPRIKEIINAAKNISTPIITALLDCDSKEEYARYVKSEIEKTLLGQIVKSIKVVIKCNEPYISVVFDEERLKDLHMDDSLESIRLSILENKKVKQVKLMATHVIIPASKIPKIRIFSAAKDKDKLQFDLHHLKSVLPMVVVKGIGTVERALIVKEKAKYKLLIKGTNLGAVLGTPGVNGIKTKSNHIMEVWYTLGIEAARRSIIDEIQGTMKSMNIDIRHMMLLADVMTSTGEVLGITRFGMTKMKDSVLMLASFEKTAEHLFNAPFHGRRDQIEGVSECIIMGIPIQFGTGILKVKQRVDSLPELKYGPEPIIR